MWKYKLGSTAYYDGTIRKKRVFWKLYELLTKCEVNMGGYWHAYSLRSRKTKKERGQYQTILTQQAWSIKDLCFTRGTQRVIQTVGDSAILPARVANHSIGFGSSCPLTELVI